MGATGFILVLALEALALCVFLVAILLLKNRKLRQLVAKFQARLQEMVVQRNVSQQSLAPSVPPQSYNDKLSGQIELTRDYHRTLGTRQDIALDLDPDAPLSRRTAALRHAFLIAEKEATASNGEIKWDVLATRYRQILTFHEDYKVPESSNNEEEVQQLKEELNQAKKRVNNLERFKSLYLELEERWDRCKDKASEHYIELKSIAEQSGHKNFTRLLDEYQASYTELGTLIHSGVNDSLTLGLTENPEEHLREIRRLRSVAIDQHRIITELQSKLASADNFEEKTQIVVSLQSELQKQARFLQESETCIRLMENELANSKQENKQLLERLSQMPQLRTELQELQTTVSMHEHIVDTLKQENRRLAKKLKLAQEAPPEDDQEVHTLRKELSSLQSKYNDLEEKFLNLKLKE